MIIQDDRWIIRTAQHATESNCRAVVVSFAECGGAIVRLRPIDIEILRAQLSLAAESQTRYNGEVDVDDSLRATPWRGAAPGRQGR